MPALLSTANVIYVGLGVIGLLIILLIVSLIRLSIAKKQLGRYQVLMDQYGEGNLEELIMTMQSELRRITEDMETINKRVQAIEMKMPEMVQKVGLVRFKGFEDVGGDLSFSAALLSGEGDGVVITALHARDDTRVYAKKVDKYVSSYPLSEEEIAAIKQTQKR